MSLNIVKTETNPRWEQAQFEAQYIVHPRVSAMMSFDPKTGFQKPLIPCRYESIADIHNSNPVPPFLVTYEDGSTEERF